VRTWRRLIGERRTLYGAIGLRLIDQITNGPPMGRIRPRLDLRSGAAWNAVERPLLVSPSGVVTCPGLERRADPTAAGPRRYRVRIDADYYLPLFRATVDGVEFDAHPYNDETPPQAFARSASDAFLAPSRAYPFPAYVRVIRGDVVDPAGDPVQDALVTEGAADRALTDELGRFALALRTAPEGVPVQITADHPRSNRTGSVTVTLPDALRRNQTIQVT
jgi:hypothetical protein